MTTTGSTQTTTEAAAEIRAELKKRGISSRQVSVRADYYSMGSSIEILIKDGAINHAKVKAIAEGKERIHRCQVTGEILGGGNRYVSVSLTPEAETIKSRRFIEATEKAIEQVKALPANHHAEVCDGYSIDKDGIGGEWFSVWGPDCRIQDAHGAAGIALVIAMDKEKREAA